ncbi:glycosyltransferase family 39 protein [Streptomyces humicola]|uniref:glycosyltransferase family 39 protein n=1 Tax=Streptomyces humicola TaxID=2953240 RepID=UPI0022B27232|nr:glycosyltransferase family 39 protein [Streptomyces humicola]
MSATLAGAHAKPARAPQDGPPRLVRALVFWRSPQDQPRWARPVLLLIAAVAGVLYAWNITSSGFAYYYSDAVKSMSVSWKALLFGAMDPGATITPDKIAGSFVPQALSARLFGFHAWSVTLPQCIEGVICVLVMYRVVRRWAGPYAGLGAAALFTFTPVVASMFGHSMEDGGLTFCLVMAADCCQRAFLDARLRSLVFAGVWVGVGFQAKMMQAWMVLPALALVYLVSAPGRLRRRIAHVAVAAVVCLAVSLSWVMLMTFVPAKDRPYVDGSTNNSAIAMVFGYNGLERFGINVPGAVASMGGGGGTAGKGGFARLGTGGTAGTGGFPGLGGSGARPGADTAGAGAPGTSGAAGPGSPAGANGAASAGSTQGAAGVGGAAGPAATAAGRGGGSLPGGTGGTGASGAEGTRRLASGPGAVHGGSSWLKLFQSRFGPQIGWMYPFALLALVLGLWWRRGRERTDRLRGGYAMWGSWLVVVGLVFSKMSNIPHTAYMSTLAPPLAALTAAGAVMMWRAYRRGGARAWALPVAVAAEAAWSWYLGSFDSGFLPWLKWTMLAASVIGVVVMVLGRGTRRMRSRLLTAGLLAGIAGSVVTPVAWSASVLDTTYAGSAFDASAGPSAMGGGGRGFSGPGGDVSTSLTASQRRLYQYVKAHQGSAEYVMATEGWNLASPYILATGDTVLPMGGFSGSVPQPSLDDFVSLVHKGEVRFVLTQGSGSAGAGMPGAGGGSGSLTGISSWVTKHCAQVPSQDYGVSASSSTSRSSTAGTGPAGMFGEAGAGGGTLYRCSPSS